MISAGGVAYGYDANGNLSSRGGASVTWKSYNLPTKVADPNGYSATFSYAPDRSRWKQVSTYVGGTETTIYMGGLLEKLTTPTRTHWKHLIATPSGQVQVIRRSDGTTDTVYVTTDHLGSTDAVLNAAGTVLLQGSFGVHGARRASNWQGAPSSTEWQAIADTTRRGYTGHEQIDNVMVVHMTRNGRTHFLNRRRRAHRARTRDGSSSGRVFDPAIGRFLSTDPYIDGPQTTQGWNRYAYVQGRVMSAMDPSGFEATAPPEEIVVSEPRQDCGFLALACNGNQRYGLPGPGYFGPPVSPLLMPQVQPSIEEVVVEAERLPQTQQPQPPCTDRFVGDSLAQSYADNYGNDTWNEIRAQRDSTAPIAPGTQSEAMRNAEHYLYSYSQVSDNSYNWGPMLAYTVGYNTAKFWTNVAEYYHVANSSWTYSINTTSELNSGFAGANDALFGRPSGRCSVGQ